HSFERFNPPPTPPWKGGEFRNRLSKPFSQPANEEARDMEWVAEDGVFLVALLAAAIGVAWLMPRAKTRFRAAGMVLAFAGGVLLALRLRAATGPLTETILFWTFAAAAVGCAVLMITSRHPVYAALWFAQVTLATCGLFLLQSAPFLAAATIIVYAGAIVVTFLFVIMLAQQSGATVADQRSRQPLAATLAAFILLGALLFTLESWPERSTDATLGPPAVSANLLSRGEPNQRLDTMNALGRSLFGDYLFAVELAGTLLLIATIGAITIAPRRPQGKA
ncbi:MAG: NADH-quinone oxidoreductase subunit J, partial [Planctomycetaceae bacterium]